MARVFLFVTFIANNRKKGCILVKRLKQLKIKTMVLTKIERDVATHILAKVYSIMRKDGDAYYDNGDFILMLDEKERRALKRAFDKLIAEDI